MRSVRRWSPVITTNGLRRMVAAMHGRTGLSATVQAVTELVVTIAGFRVAAVSVSRGDGSFETVAVAGSEDARRQLTGVRRSRQSYDEEFAVAQPWGRLLFVPHERLPDARERGWIPPTPTPTRRHAWHPLDALYAPLRSPAGELVGVLSVDLPVRGRRPGQRQRDLLEILAIQAGIAVDNARLTAELLAEKELFKLAFHSSGAGMVLLSLNPADRGRHVQVNSAFCRIVGRTAAELLELTIDDLLHPEDSAGDWAPPSTDAAAGPHQFERRYLRSDGSTVWIAATVSQVNGPDDLPRYAVVQAEDITGRRQRQLALQHRAHHDPLTNLPNRTALLQRLQQANESAQRVGRPGALLFLDLNNFKHVNDRYGHQVGDQVLTTLATRLRAAVLDRHMAGRLGGDEFLVVAEDVDEPDVQGLMAAVAAAVATPVRVAGTTILSSVSIGCSPIPAHAADPHELIVEADRAMYRDKQRWLGERRT